MSNRPSTGEAAGVRLRKPRYVSTFAMATSAALPGIAPAVDRDLDRLERLVRQVRGRRPEVREEPQEALTRTAEALDLLLDLLEKAVAPVREEQLVSGDAHVRPHEIAPAEEIDDRLGLTGVLERAGEQVAEARGHRREGNRQPDGGPGDRADRRVTPDGDEMRERRLTRGGPRLELAQRAKRPHAGRVALRRQFPAHPVRDGHRPAGARARSHDDLDSRRHGARRSHAEAGHDRITAGRDRERRCSAPRRNSR